MSPRSTTRLLYFWCFVSNSAFFKWQMSISEAKWTFAPDVLASSITSFLLLTFVRFHAGIFANFSPSLSIAAFTSEFDSTVVFFGALAPTPNFWDDKDPSMTQNEFVYLHSLLHWSSFFLFLTFVSCHVGIFSNFSHSFSTAAFAPGICNGWEIGINLCTEL